MAEYTLKLDEDRDITFDEAGIMEVVEDPDVPVQNVRTTLDTWQGEFLLDETYGTDYDRVFLDDEQLGPGEEDQIIRDAIFQEPGVVSVKTLEVEVTNRKLTASFSGELTDSGTLESEVMMNDRAE